MILFRRLKSNILGVSEHEYASGGTLASTLAKLGLKQSTVARSETPKFLSLSLDGLQVNGETFLNGAASFVLCGDRSESTNAGTVDHLLDKEGVYHFTHLIDGGRFVTENACATLEDVGVVLFLKDASAKKRGVNTCFAPMDVSAASSLPNEEVNIHDMRVPATNLSKDAPQFDRGKLT